MNIIALAVTACHLGALVVVALRIASLMAIAAAYERHPKRPLSQELIVTLESALKNLGVMPGQSMGARAFWTLFPLACLVIVSLIPALPLALRLAFPIGYVYVHIKLYVQLKASARAQS